MSILDTFYILFKTDAEEAARDIEKVDKASDGAAAGLSKMDLAAGKVGSSFIAMARNLAAPLLALASVGTITSAVFERINQIGDIGDAATKLRSSVQEYDALTRAVRAAGGEMMAVQANIATFSDKLNDAAARPDGPNAKNFKKWGIAFKDVKGEAVGAVEGLLSLAKSLEGVSRAEALGRLRRLGIEDADTIEFLLQGKKAIEEKMRAEREAGVVTDRQIELEGAYQATMGRLRNSLDSVANGLTEILIPALISGAEAFMKMMKWVKENRTLVEGFFMGVAGIVTGVYLPAMAKAAWATLRVVAPFLGIIATLALVGVAFALAYEDIRAFMEGQPSLIGALASKYKWFGDAVKDVQDIFEDLRNAMKWLASEDSGKIGEIANSLLSLSGLDAAALGVGALTLALSPLSRTLFMFALAFYAAKAGLDYLSQLKSDQDARVASIVAQENPAAKPGYVKGEGYDEEGKMIYMEGNRRVDTPARKPTEGYTDEALDYKFQLMEEEGRRIEEQLSQAKEMMDNASSAPINGQTAQTIAPVTNNDITNTVNVGGVVVNTQATDAAGVAAAVDSALASKLRQTAAQFDDGVAR